MAGRVPGLPPLFVGSGVRVPTIGAGGPATRGLLSLATPWSAGDIRLPARAESLPGQPPVVLPEPRRVAERGSSALR
jgi:hypothetical protein